MKGNRIAHKELYSLYKNAWVITSLRYGSNQQESEDILQEGVLQIYKDLHQFNSDKASFKTWSQRVIVHAALRYIRKNSWQNLFIDIDDYSKDLYVENDQLSSISANEILGYIRQLPAGYKLVFNLYAIEGFNHKEIANRLNITEGTSKSQLFKARRMLKKIIEKSYIDE